MLLYCIPNFNVYEINLKCCKIIHCHEFFKKYFTPFIWSSCLAELNILKHICVIWVGTSISIHLSFDTLFTAPFSRYLNRSYHLVENKLKITHLVSRYARTSIQVMIFSGYCLTWILWVASKQLRLLHGLVWDSTTLVNSLMSELVEDPIASWCGDIVGHFWLIRNELQKFVKLKFEFFSFDVNDVNKKFCIKVKNFAGNKTAQNKINIRRKINIEWTFSNI